MSRISDLLLRIGEIEGQRAQQGGQMWGQAIAALGQAPATIGQMRRQASEDALRTQEQKASIGASEATTRNANDAIDRRRVDADVALDDRKMAENTRRVERWLLNMVGISDPEKRLAVYRSGREALMADGTLDADDAPEQFYGLGWVKSQLVKTGMAADKIQQVLPDAPPTKTREVKVRNVDGSETIQIVKDEPDQSFTSAPPPPSDFEWVTRGGQSMQVPKGTAQPGDRPYQPPSTAQPDSEWVLRGGNPVQIRKGTAQPGDRPYEKATNGDPDAQREAAETASEVVRIATALKNHPGVGGAFGIVHSRIPTMRQETANAETLRDALMSLLTLENMGKMKGVLSDADMKVLRQASTTLAPQMGDVAAIQELDRLIGAMGRVRLRPGAIDPNNLGQVNVPARRPNPFEK